MLPKFRGNFVRFMGRVLWAGVRLGNGATHRPRKQASSVRKIMATVFWDRKGNLLIDFLERGLTIIVKLWGNLDGPFKTKDVECCPVGLCFCMTMPDLIPQIELLNCCNNFAGKFLTTRPTAPISCQFMHIKKWLASQSFEYDDRLKTGVTTWFKSPVAGATIP